MTISLKITMSHHQFRHFRKVVESELFDSVLSTPINTRLSPLWRFHHEIVDTLYMELYRL